MKLNDYGEAYESCIIILNIFEKYYGKNDIKLCETLEKLSKAFYKNEEYYYAKKSCKLSLKIKKEFYGE
jgi:hypothetical protein